MNEARFSERDNTWYNWEILSFDREVSWALEKNSERLSALSDCINCFYKRYYLPTNHSAMGLQGFILFWKGALYKNIHTPEISISCICNHFYQEDVYPSRANASGAPIFVFFSDIVKKNIALFKDEGLTVTIVLRLWWGSTALLVLKHESINGSVRRVLRPLVHWAKWLLASPLRLPALLSWFFNFIFLNHIQ